MSKNHFRIEGTKLFVLKPDNTKYIEDINVFKFNDSTYIHVLSIQNNFLDDLKENNFDFFHNMNYKVISKQEFRINNLPGVYFKLKENNSYWLYFMFGDSTVENRIVATYPITKTFQKEIFNFVENIYYEPDFNLNELENAKFKIDLSNIGFEFYKLSMNQYMFFDKKKYLNEKKNNELPNYITIAQSPFNGDSTMFEKTSNSILQGMINYGLIIEKVKFKGFVRVNNKSCYKIILEAKEKERNTIIYMFSTGNSKTQIQLTADLFLDGYKFIPKIDKSLFNMKIK